MPCELYNSLQQRVKSETLVEKTLKYALHAAGIVLDLYSNVYPIVFVYYKSTIF